VTIDLTSAIEEQKLMRVAGSVDLREAVEALASTRRIFHSEADFQHALAWQIHSADPRMKVRLETHPEPNVRLDLLLSRPDLGRHTAIELKYPTALWSGDVDGEHFALKNHGAQDITSYDIVKDIHRVERFASSRQGWNGAVVVVTNDPAYWRVPTHGRSTNADAFRTHEGIALTGQRAWGPKTGAGTMKSRESALTLEGSYGLRWNAFSSVGDRNGDFRYLSIEIPSDADDPA
jgi:hypothetical protein